MSTSTDSTRNPKLGSQLLQRKRTIGTFQLMMFGVVATVGTGVFFILQDAVPEAGPSVMVSFVLAGLVARDDRTPVDHAILLHRPRAGSGLHDHRGSGCEER